MIQFKSLFGLYSLRTLYSCAEPAMLLPFASVLSARKARRKQTDYCWPPTPSIVGWYMRTLLHVVSS